MEQEVRNWPLIGRDPDPGFSLVREGELRNSESESPVVETKPAPVADSVSNAGL